jgi:mRNA-degrading endonuclease YafQ of YafQ-DinJ toxin-antitoxin module
MRTIERSSAFRRDYQRVKAAPRHSKDVDSLVSSVVASLLVDRALPDPDTLRLARLGSHSELFG